MSNLLFTPPNFLGWSVFKSPQFKTQLQQAAGGKTTRSQLWANPIWNYKLTWEILRDSGTAPTAFKQLIDFFLARAGQFDTFLYQDPNDNAVAGQLLGYGNGSATKFQLARSFLNFYEAMQNPNAVTNVYLNGVAQAAFSYAIGTENLILQSQTLDNAAWSTFSSITVTANATAAPDGTSTAEKLARLGSGGSYAIGQFVNFAANGIRQGDQLTFSCYGLQGTVGVKMHLRLVFEDASGNILLDTAQAAQTLTGSWQRFIWTQTVPIGATQVQCNIHLDNTSSVGDFIYAWGAQLERWPSASGYLATTTAIVQPLGVVTFSSAPAAGVAVTADFSYYYRLRFKQDINEFEQFMNNLWALKTLELVSERV